ncbi:hypothetical protein V6N13_029802 [Hibiscus sabdariffa]
MGLGSGSGNFASGCSGAYGSNIATISLCWRGHSGERNVVADKLADLGKQQPWEGITYVIPPIGLNELVADEQRLWMEHAAVLVELAELVRQEAAAG